MKQQLDWLKFGESKPSGWIREVMARELEAGFVGHLDDIVPDLIKNDEIYGRNRLSRSITSKSLGAIAQDSDWEVQYLWWNSETQSNWWDGFVRTSLLVGNREYETKALSYVESRLSSQDADGYLGVYAKDLRFCTKGENGELWALATLGRSMLAWYEAKNDPRVLESLERACRKVMEAWPKDLSHPFGTDPSYAGVAHGLAVTDVFNRLWELTGNHEYLQYAGFLFADYNSQKPSEKDILVRNLEDPHYAFKGHGVHTYEHFRALLIARVAACGSEKEELDKAIDAYLEKLDRCLTPSGAPAGDEWIAASGADASLTGYEYCSIQELLDTYSMLLKLTGDLAWGDRIEHLFFNAALGARHPEGHSITYLKTDNCLKLDGTGPTHNDGGKTALQVRYKYSPAHQDAAVCCAPNAARVFPTYIRCAWMRNSEGLTLVGYGPGELRSNWKGKVVLITQSTEYPKDFTIQLKVKAESSIPFMVSLRKPQWAEKVILSGSTARITEYDDRIDLVKDWSEEEQLSIEFISTVRECQDRQGNWHIEYGPLVYCLGQPSREALGRLYAKPFFQDRFYFPLGTTMDSLKLVRGSAKYFDGKITAEFQPDSRSDKVSMELVPMAWTILRQVTFPAAP